MKKSKFSDEQMVQILREADRTDDVAGTAKKHGISDQTVYIWRKRFGAMTPDDTRRLRMLESENGKLKKLLADRLVEIDVLKEINEKKGERARTSRARRVRQTARSVETTCVRAALLTATSFRRDLAGEPICSGPTRFGENGG
jgi:putative transposase